MCGINGIWAIKGAVLGKDMVEDWEKSFIAIDRRGGHASGFYAKGHVIKAPVRAAELLRLVHTLNRNYLIGAHEILGHTRFATVGDKDSNENNHPFSSKHFILAHNGSHYGSKEVKHYVDTVMRKRPETDSWELLEAIEYYYRKTGSVKEAVEKALDGAWGNYAVWLYNKVDDVLYLFRDGNPIWVGRYKDYIAFASEKKQLPKHFQKNAFSPRVGYLYKITRNGVIKKEKLNYTQGYYTGKCLTCGAQKGYDDWLSELAPTKTPTKGAVGYSLPETYELIVNGYNHGTISAWNVDTILDELEYERIPYEVTYDVDEVRITVPSHLLSLTETIVSAVKRGGDY